MSVGAVYDRAFFLESTKYARSQTALTIDFHHLDRLVPEKGNLRGDADLDLTVRPAALEALPALAGIVVEHNVQHILTGSTECGCGRRLTCKRNSGGST